MMKGFDFKSHGGIHAIEQFHDEIKKNKFIRT